MMTHNCDTLIVTEHACDGWTTFLCVECRQEIYALDETCEECI